jgi:cbb3-type cytochrome oxidase subunit 3
MSVSALFYILFTLLLSVVFGGIILYYFNPKRKHQVEKPKHRMLDDDEH